MLSSLRRLAALARRRPCLLWHDPAYRLPLSGTDAIGLDSRRAEDAAFYLLQRGAFRPADVRAPRVASYEELARVHSVDYLESLSRPESLAPIFGADPGEIVVDELLRVARLGCGATVDAAAQAVSSRRSSLNLLGGFHHARPSAGGGFCAVNDIAVAVKALRADGFEGAIAVLDLDAHPPDGTAECLAGVPGCWIGSLSGSAWGALPGVDEVLLPPGAGDDAYLAALDCLLLRMTRSALAFVVAGGDVLAGDRFGQLALTLEGVRRRDLRVLAALGDTPAVWLPGGGYSPSSWKVLAGTGLALALRSTERIPRRFDPLTARFSRITRTLAADPTRRDDEPLLTEQDIAEALGVGRPAERRLMGFYTAEGIELALHRYGLLPHLKRLGYGDFRVEIGSPESSERVRLFGRSGATEHLLVEAVLERRRIGSGTFLFVNWLSLRNPRARFSEQRPQLPGQDVPGLGLAREIAEILALVADRLLLDGIAFRPAWYHIAYAGRYLARFVDPRRQGRFEALMRALAGVPLLEATTAVAQGRVLLDGAPYAWEADDMVYWRRGAPAEQEVIAAERDRVMFSMIPGPP